MAKVPKEQRRAVNFRRALSRLAPQLLTDFEFLLEDAAQADDEDYEGDEVVQLARRGRLLQQREAEEMAERGFSSITPESAPESKLGSVALFKYAPTQADVENGIKQSDTVVYWQGKKRDSIPLTLDLIMFDGPQVGQGARPSARLVYGSGSGRTNDVEVDVGRGQRVTVAGNYVSALIQMDPIPSGQVSGTMKLGGALSFYAAAASTVPMRTRYVDSIAQWAGTGTAAGQPGEADLVVPPRAQVLLPVCGPLGSGCRVDFLDYAGERVYSRAYLIGQWPEIPVTCDVETVRFYNLVGGTASFRLPFGLSL